MTSKVAPEETQQVKDAKTDQPGAPKSNAVVLSTAQPKKIQMPTRYANTIWLARPPPTEGCPPGLEYLLQLDSFSVNQRRTLLETFTGFDANNIYSINALNGPQVFLAMEDSTFCNRFCFGNNRGFEINMMDNTGTEVMRITRDFNFCLYCVFRTCYNSEIVIEAPVGVPIGFVQFNQLKSCMGPYFSILDENHQKILKLVYQNSCGCCPDFVFKLKTLEDVEIGMIVRPRFSSRRDFVAENDNFFVEFPIDLSVKTKATLIGAAMLIDFMYFEAQQQGHERSIGGF